MSYPAAYEEACSHLFFDPDEHPENTLKTSQEFIQRFQLRDDLLYPEPPKVSLEAAIERGENNSNNTWKHITKTIIKTIWQDFWTKKTTRQSFEAPIDYTLIGAWLCQKRKQEQIYTGVILLKQSPHTTNQQRI